MSDSQIAAIEGIPLDELRVPVGFETVHGTPKIVENARSIRVLPASAPIRWVAFWMFVPFVVGIWSLIFGPMNPRQFNFGIGVWVVVLVMFILASVTMAGFLWLIIRINRQQLDAGPFLVLDKVRGKLSLPRQGIEMTRDDLIAVVELNVRVTQMSARPTTSEYTHVSVLHRDGGGAVVRSPIVTDCDFFRPSRRVSTFLQSYFDIPVHHIEGDRETPFVAEPSKLR